MGSERAAIAASPHADTVTLTGVAGVYLLAFSLWLSTAGAHVSLGLLVTATLMDRSRRSELLRDPMLKVLGLLAAYLALHAAAAIWHEPKATTALWDTSWEWLKPLLILLLVAYWLQGNERRIGTALLLALIGLIVRIGFEVESTGIGPFLNADRNGFGFAITSFGLFTSTALLGLLLLAPRIRELARAPLGQGLVIATWCAAFVILSQGLIVSQTRNTWIAVMIIYPLVLSARLLAALRNLDRSSLIRVASMILIVIAATAGILAHNWGTIKQRASQEPATWQALLGGDLDHVEPNGSIGTRVRIAEYGVEKWLERPFFGWGPQASRELIRQSEEPQLRGLAHFHNIYLEMLIGLGIVGTALFAVAGAYLGKVLYQAVRARRMPLDYALYAIGGGGLLMISALSDFGLPQVAWKLHFAMLGAIVYGYRYQTSDIRLQ